MYWIRNDWHGFIPNCKLSHTHLRRFTADSTDSKRIAWIANELHHHSSTLTSMQASTHTRTHKSTHTSAKEHADSLVFRICRRVEHVLWLPLRVPYEAHSPYEVPLPYEVPGAYEVPLSYEVLLSYEVPCDVPGPYEVPLSYGVPYDVPVPYEVHGPYKVSL